MKQRERLTHQTMFATHDLVTLSQYEEQDDGPLTEEPWPTKDGHTYALMTPRWLVIKGSQYKIRVRSQPEIWDTPFEPQ